MTFLGQTEQYDWIYCEYTNTIPKVDEGTKLYSDLLKLL